jgi:glutamine amidotransferase
MQTITIVDYGMGNLFSVKKKLDKLKAKVIISSDPEVVRNAEKLILPGVGHFGKAMENLRQANLIEALNDAVLKNKTPILGICLGMQLMATFSEEGNVEGLGWFDAQVLKFQVSDSLRFKVPHVGWNQINSSKSSKLMTGIGNEAEFYFVHSYYVKVNNASDELNSANYELPFTAAIEKGNIFGVQYHPEKSHDVGEILLRNFVEL